MRGRSWILGWALLTVVACRGHAPPSPVTIEPAEDLVTLVEEVSLAGPSVEWWASTHVWQLEFSPDERYMAAYFAFPDRVRLWRVRAWHQAPVVLEPAWRMAFSPNGRYLAACVPEGLRVWAVDTWQVLVTLGTGPDCMKVRFSPDQRYLASLHGPDILRLWQVDTWALVQEIHISMSSIEFSPDARVLAWADGGRVCIWSVGAASPPFCFERRGEGPGLLRFSPDGQYLVVGNQVWRSGSWELVTTLKTPPVPSFLGDLRFSPDGKYLIGALERWIIVWKTGTWEVIATFLQQDSVAALAVSPSDRLAGGFFDGSIRVWRFVALSPLLTK